MKMVQYCYSTDCLWGVTYKKGTYKAQFVNWRILLLWPALDDNLGFMILSPPPEMSNYPP